MRREMAAAVAAIVPETGLVGLNSADFVVGDEAWWLLEINPRPGATLDIFRDGDGRLFAHHVEACRGSLPDEPLRFSGSAAAAIVYASASIASVPAIDWPEWAADRQAPGTQVAEGEPLCTVLAEAETAEEAVRLVHERKLTIRDRLEKGAPS
jgi:predicted ATP-grasp superfamily ATP-dependent carboligase